MYVYVRVKVSVGVTNSDIKMSSSVDPPEYPKKWLLPERVHFGFHTDYCSDEVTISEDKTLAIKVNAQMQYAKGVVFSEKPLKGLCEFEVELTGYGTTWSGNIKLGIMRHQSKIELDKSTIPRYSPESPEYCVWCASRLHDRIKQMAELPYGHKTLDELREKDRLGFQITSDGVMSFFLNGVHQGEAVHDVYSPGWDVYAVVDHYGNSKSTRVTRAIMRVQCSLQELCLDKIAYYLPKKAHIEKLPLPLHMKKALNEYVYVCED